MAIGGTQVNAVDRLIVACQERRRAILVVGDGMTDIYVGGHLEDTCQEGCAKYMEDVRVVVPGGASNAAQSLRYWEANVLDFTRAGPGTGPTKTRFMVGNRCVFRHDDDQVNFDQSVVRAEALHALRTRKPDAVLLSDYNKGMLTEEFIREVVGGCKKLNIPCVADVNRDPELYVGCVLKCNNTYYEAHFESIRSHIRDWVVVTYGDKPPYIQHIKGEVIDQLPHVECINHVGAGDCFAAHLTLALAHGFSLRDAAAVAHSAGRVYVQFSCNKPPRPKEVAEDIVRGVGARC